VPQKGLETLKMSPSSTHPERRQQPDLDDYDVDLDEIFGDITSPRDQNDDGTKRKAQDNADDLGDEPVAKRARAPRVKLDEQRWVGLIAFRWPARIWMLMGPFQRRLLSDEGIPRLQARAKGLKFKGKSHEVPRHPARKANISAHFANKS
jgi:hypothetical protein